MKGMNSLRRQHVKVKDRQTSFRIVPESNTQETSQQKFERAVLPAGHSELVAGDFHHEGEQQGREDLTEHGGASRQQVDCPARMCSSAAAGEVRSTSSTDHPASAAAGFVSLQNYSDYVVMVPTPRTSSPIIDDPSPTSAGQLLQTDASLNVENLEQANVRQDDDADHDNRNAAVGHGSSKDAARNRGSSQLQKTVGRLKRYFGLAAACGTSSESRHDDASLASNREVTSRPSTTADREKIEAVDDHVTKHRTFSLHGDSLDTAAATAGSHRVLPLDSAQMGRVLHHPEKYATAVRRVSGYQLTSRQRRDPVSHAVKKPAHAAKDDMALQTVVPGVRVRVPPRRQLSQHERPMRADADSNHVQVTATQTGTSWLQEDDAHARSRANVERWLSQTSSDANRGARSDWPMTRQQRHRHSIQQRTNHVLRSQSRDRSEAPPDRSRMERSVSETDVPAAAAADRGFRSRDQHGMTTPSRSSVARTPPSAGARSTGAEAESRLGPSLVQLVAEIIEGLEQQRSRDDSSAVWSGVRAAGTPAAASRILFHQQHGLTTRVRDTDALLAASRTRAIFDDRRQSTEDPSTNGGQQRDSVAGSPGKTSNPSQQDDKTGGDHHPTNEAVSEKTLTGRRGDHTTTERKPSVSATIPSSCSVAVLRQRLLRAVEGSGSGSRRPSTDPPTKRRSTEGTQTETETDTAPGNFQSSSASVTCTTGKCHDSCTCRCIMICWHAYRQKLETRRHCRVIKC